MHRTTILHLCTLPTIAARQPPREQAQLQGHGSRKHPLPDLRKGRQIRSHALAGLLTTHTSAPPAAPCQQALHRRIWGENDDAAESRLKTPDRGETHSIPSPPLSGRPPALRCSSTYAEEHQHRRGRLLRLSRSPGSRAAALASFSMPATPHTRRLPPSRRAPGTPPPPSPLAAGEAMQTASGGGARVRS
jgi:hypothetical protein